MKKITSIAIAMITAATAQCGILTIPAKIAAKVVGHSADNVVGHVVTHNADDVARLAAKGAAKGTARTAPKVVRAVDTAVTAARVETQAAKPVVNVIHRIPIAKPSSAAVEAAIKQSPKIAVGAGVGSAALLAANNMTKGERDIDMATGEAIRGNPELARDRITASGKWKDTLAKCGGAGIILACLGLAFRIVGPLRLRRKGRSPLQGNGESPESTPALAQ